ncbi:antibiotic biosynthesis monooxygenase family protein [Paenirhodobacter populi]|uniref:Antibiotic biosynthesis monooxygenase n=1 Tax=Paenirhodobacter populi TaxID=2306993 RepID=A0A443IL81_9RHOB|nr:antibiotic biosynthesis monooxygenase [Sinirhodobacter populi]RWR05765.1 antibiotic biosynthesis monooxygenase [Sinirhodobacter populi]
MIHEVAAIQIKPEAGILFERAFLRAVPLFERAKGCRFIRLERSVEDPLRYLIVIGWDMIEDHVSGFRSSEDYGRWRDLVGDLFAAPPLVDHTEVIVAYSLKDIG